MVPRPVTGSAQKLVVGFIHTGDPQRMNPTTLKPTSLKDWIVVFWMPSNHDVSDKLAIGGSEFVGHIIWNLK